MATDTQEQTEQNYMCDPDADGGFVYTTLEAAINWMHKYSLWPMPMGTSCCAIEYMAASCSRYDISRFGRAGEAHMGSDAGAEVVHSLRGVRVLGRDVPFILGVAGCG